MSVIAEFYALIKGDSSQLQSELNKTKTSLNGTKTEMDKFSAASIVHFAAMAGAAYGFTKTILDLADGAMEYGLQVHDMALITGDSVEQTSMLIQAADDARISYDELSTAMKLAVKQGIDPSLEGMMALADQYNALATPIERDQFLIETFGRSGLKMGKLLEGGAAGIKASADEARNLGLVLTPEAVTNAENYFKSIDKLNDSIKGFKQSLGSGLIPTIKMLTDGLSNGVSLWNVFRIATDQASNSNIGWLRTLGQVESVLMGFSTSGIPGAIQAFNDLNGAVESNLNITKDDLEYTDRWAIKLSDVAEEAEKAKSAVESLNDTQINIGGDAESALEKIRFLEAGGQTIVDLQARLDEAFNESNGSPQALQDYENGLKSVIAMQADVNISMGNMTEWQGIVDIKEKLGLATYAEAKDLLSSIRGQMALLDGMEATTTITTIHRSVYEQGIYNSGVEGGLVGGGATGGYFASGGYAKGGYLVGERGPEVVTPSKSGFVAPNDTANINLSDSSIEKMARAIGNQLLMARA